MKFIIDHIDFVVMVAVPVGMLVVVLVIKIGQSVESKAGMMHENEPQGPKRWRSSAEKTKSYMPLDKGHGR